MANICFIVIAGLDQQLLRQTPNLRVLSGFASQLPLRPVLPAVTCTMQATLTTGQPAGEHGIIANGLYTHNRAELHPLLDCTSFGEFRQQVSFWEQSNELLECPRFWQGMGKKVAMLFWQNSMGGAADIVITPKPTHAPDGKTLTACWSAPGGLYEELVATLGPFPLQHYWGPMSGLPASQWILRAAQEVWRKHRPALQLVYLPHMDYNLQRRGPQDPSVIHDLQSLDAAMGPLMEDIRHSGGIPIIVGDYSMTAVNTPILPNLAFRQANLLATRPDENGKLLVDFDRSAAFAMVDHQIAHVYCQAGRRDEVVRLLRTLGGIERLLVEPAELAEAGLTSGRSGDIIALASANAWFAHDWWLADAEKPAWQFSVDIHRKPGFDPREVFFDPANKRVAQDPYLVKGSHGLVSVDPFQWPVLLCDAAIAPRGPSVNATAIAAWLKGLLA